MEQHCIGWASDFQPKEMDVAVLCGLCQGHDPFLLTRWDVLGLVMDEMCRDWDCPWRPLLYDLYWGVKHMPKSRFDSVIAEIAHSKF